MLTVCILVVGLYNLKAQEIFIVAYKGDIKFNDGRLLNHNFRYALDRGMSVVFDIGSSAVLFSKDKYFSVEKVSIKTTYNYIDFVNRFNTKMAEKNTFNSYLQKTHFFSTEVKESSKGAVVGGLKGIDNNNGKLVRDINETIFPQDSGKVLTNTVHLKWEVAGKTFGTMLIVVNNLSHDTIYNKVASNKGELDIVFEKEGVYSWFLFSKLENKKSINRVIIKPSFTEKSRIQKELEDFKAQITNFDEELQQLLLDDYLYQNSILE